MATASRVRRVASGRNRIVHALPSETPAQLQVPAGALDYTKRDVMIPMRDGIKLHTVILIPKGVAARAFSQP